MNFVTQPAFVSVMAAPGVVAVLFSLPDCDPCQLAKAVFEEASNDRSLRIDRWLVVEMDPDPAVFAWLEDTFRLTVTPSFALLCDGRMIARRPGIHTKSGILSAARLAGWLKTKLATERVS